MTDSLLQISQLVVGYPERVLSAPITLTLPVGTKVGIIGGNGTGKTTLVKTLLGLIPPLQGGFHWRVGTRFGYVPQESQVDVLVPLTVDDLLKMGLFPDLPRLRSWTGSVKKRVEGVLTEMEIGHLRSSLVRNLSSGERQRALIARAWISRPKVLVMDEPFNFLDYRFKENLWRTFSAWQKDHDLSLLLIDHDLNRIVNQVEYLVVLGPEGTVFGPVREVLLAETLSRAYGAPLHVHQEDGLFQVHFL